VKNLFTLLEARVRTLAEHASEVAKCTQELTQKEEDKDAHTVAGCARKVVLRKVSGRSRT